jgi:hypothetical protein
MNRKDRRGTQCQLDLETNICVTYEIVHQYATDGAGKRSKAPVCYMLYEVRQAYENRRKHDKTERFIGTYSTKQAAQDAAYEAYLAHFPGAQGRFAPQAEVIYEQAICEPLFCM